MKKLTVFIEGHEKKISFDDSIVVVETDAKIFVKTATVFWNYNNVYAGYNDYITYGGTKTALEKGYWTFNMIVKELEKLGGVKVSLRKHNGKCYITTDKVLKLHTFGELLGWSKDATITTSAVSPRTVDINRGLRYVMISCDKTDGSISTEGKRISVISTLPISGTTSLKGGVTQYVDVESRSRLRKGIFNEMTFKVHTNNGHKNVGSVLLDLYIL